MRAFIYSFLALAQTHTSTHTTTQTLAGRSVCVQALLQRILSTEIQLSLRLLSLSWICVVSAKPTATTYRNAFNNATYNVSANNSPRLWIQCPVPMHNGRTTDIAVITVIRPKRIYEYTHTLRRSTFAERVDNVYAYAMYLSVPILKRPSVRRFTFNRIPI